MKQECKYNSQVWLNPPHATGNGNMRCYDGVQEKDGVQEPIRFVTISDCYETIRLHPIDYDDNQSFIDKLTIMRDEIDKFINHLKTHRQ